MRSLSFIKISLVISAAITPLLLWHSVFAQGGVTGETGYRKIKPPSMYGTVLMNRLTADAKTVKPVLFPHWAHRAKYTCKACHTDLAFPMKANTVDIRQADIEAGKYCGKCHNGTLSFGLSVCDRCHSYGMDVLENHKIEDALKDLQKDDFGNRVNWVAAQRDGKIKPQASADGKGEMTVLDLDIIIPVTKFTPHPPDVVFPHKAHTEQADCAACHPAIFNQKKGGNPEMNMMKIIAGQYCGECHGKVSFPLDDCFRCHSQPFPKPEEPKKDEKKDEKPAADKDKKDKP